MQLISAVDKNWGIGNNNKLLFHIPKDMKIFKEITLKSGVVVMGRKTYESMGGPLEDRVNIVLTSDPSFKNDLKIDTLFGKITITKIARDFEEARSIIKSKDPTLKNTCVIGGESIYKLFKPYCTKALITKVDIEAPEVDSYFPNLDEDDNWRLAESSDKFIYNDIGYSFNRYYNLDSKIYDF